MPQQLRLHSGNRYDHHAHQHDRRNDQVPWHAPPPRPQLSFHDHQYNRVTQQRPYARPQYDQVQSSRREVRFENYFSANELVQIAMQNFLHMTSYLLSVFWNKLSKQVGRDDYSRDNGLLNHELSRIFDLTRRKIRSFQPIELSLTTHGIAKIASVVEEGGSTRNKNRVEAALQSLLLGNVIHHGLFDTIANHIVALENLNGFSPQSLANIVWAFAKVELPQPELFSKIAEHIVQLPSLSLPRFDPQNLTNILWAYAKAGITHHQLYRKIIGHILGKKS
eukprot:scaffold488_cov109-Skeletonema_dohrnii-CCMP3373.AAC.8